MPAPPGLLQDQECEHLRQVMKEMSVSRASVATAKVEMQEQLVALQVRGRPRLLLLLLLLQREVK